MINILNRLLKKYLNYNKYSLGISHFIKIRPNYNNYKNLNDLDYKIYSQNGEDGIIDYLLSSLSIDKPKFLEIGVGDYSECNTRFVYERSSTKGVVIDCIEDLENKISKNVSLWRGDLKIVNKRISSQNIIDSLNEFSALSDLDLFSLDIDGIDYWVLKKMPSNFSKIAVIEYNSVFGPDFKITTPDIKNFDRKKYHFSNLCFGASLRAIIDLMQEKNFTFVGTNLTRCNAFFVHNNYSDFINTQLPDLENLSQHTNSNIRESRDRNDNLNYLSGNERIKNIFECEIFDIEDQKLKQIQNLFKEIKSK